MSEIALLPGEILHLYGDHITIDNQDDLNGVAWSYINDKMYARPKIAGYNYCLLEYSVGSWSCLSYEGGSMVEWNKKEGEGDAKVLLIGNVLIPVDFLGDGTIVTFSKHGKMYLYEGYTLVRIVGSKCNLILIFNDLEFII